MSVDAFRRSLPPLARDPRPSGAPASLPPAYGREKLTAVVRDPNRVWLYWELSPAKLSQLAKQAAKAKPELHLVQAETRRPLKEAACDLSAGSAWLDALPGETYLAELGLADFGRPFTVLLRSEAFRLPWGEALRERRRPSLDLPEELRRFRPPKP